MRQTHYVDSVSCSFFVLDFVEHVLTFCTTVFVLVTVTLGCFEYKSEEQKALPIGNFLSIE
jgi:hypothetical protein